MTNLKMGWQQTKTHIDINDNTHLTDIVSFIVFLNSFFLLLIVFITRLYKPKSEMNTRNPESAIAKEYWPKPS